METEYKPFHKSYYEKFADGTVKCIDEEIPFDIPESWEWTRWSNCFQINPKNSIEDSIDVSFVPMAYIKDEYSNEAKFDIKKWKGIKSGFTHFQNNDLGIAKITPCFENRKSVIFTNLHNGYGAGTTELHIFRPFAFPIIASYALYIAKTEGFISNGIANFSGAVGQQRVGKDIIGDYLIALPPLIEIYKILSSISKLFLIVDGIENDENQLSSYIQNAKSKILDLAIRGKLVPQDLNDEPASVLLERIKAEYPEGKKKAKNTRDNSHYPFEIPAGWEWSRLGCIASYKKGPFGSSITKSMFIPDSITAIKVYEQKNAIYKDSNLGNYYISEAKFEELKGFEVLPNDILVSCAGTIGETYVMPQYIRKGIINQALMRIKLYNYEMLDFYLMYFDFVLKNQAKQEGKGTAIKNIPPFDILKNFLIPIPPLSEQKQIIKQIKEIFASLDGIANSIKA